MARNDKGKARRRDWDPAYMFKTRVDLPTSKGKFRNMFPEMVPKPKRTSCCAHCVHCPHCAQSGIGAAESE